MSTKLQELKSKIKAKAVKNRELKKEIVSTQKSRGSGAAWKQQGELHASRLETRALLRAYGFLRNIPLEDIEPNAKNTEPSNYNEYQIRRMTEEFIEEYSTSLEEAHEG